MFNVTSEHKHSRLNIKDRGDHPFDFALDQLCETDVVALQADDTIYDAAEQMSQKHIGNVLITEDRDGKTAPVGILTDRDIVMNVVAKGLDPKTVKISQVMTSNIVTASEDDGLSTLISVLTNEGVGRLPIVGKDGSLKGILTSKRLFQFFAQGLCELSSLSDQQHQREESTH